MIPALPPPLIDPSLEKILFDLGPKEKLERYHQDLAADEYSYGKTINEETQVTEHDKPVTLPSLENIVDNFQKKQKEKRKCSKESPKNASKKQMNIRMVKQSMKKHKSLNMTHLPSLKNIVDNFQKKQKEKRKRSKESPKNANKKLKTESVESKRTSGIFVGYWEKPPEMKVAGKRKRKFDVKHECIDEVTSVESMKDAEKVLWYTHYDQLCDKLNYVICKKCPECQTNEPNQLAHKLCIMSSSEEQVNLCFEEAYKHVILDEVLDNWYKKALEMPVNLNPETLIIFREIVNPRELTYENRLRKWLIEFPTIEH